ncbi:hypothetical protein [Agrobacterium tumefaciens]|uniref:hypothetical protein n=1 Tax=Agrobacterium tumefaciens TaxID=358 RepID=UPI001573AC50|nr:hypothetical protein [Agrobacterium tumefaciens]NTB01319.1 hypothetical protein [Agrobacterium tumefaciens]
MKNCLSNVAEIARNHDIFGPIDERIWDRVQAVSDFYTAFPGNIGKLRINVENDGAFTFSSFRKRLRPARIAPLPSSPCHARNEGADMRVSSQGAVPRTYPAAAKERLLPCPDFPLRQIRLF